MYIIKLMKMNRGALRKYVISASLVLNLALVRSVNAIDIILPPNPTPDENLLDFIYRMINLAIGMAGLIAVVFLIYNGIQYILSAGEESKVEKATKGITYAIIGLVICFVSVLIVNFILNNVIQVV